MDAAADLAQAQAPLSCCQHCNNSRSSPVSSTGCSSPYGDSCTGTRKGSCSVAEMAVRVCNLSRKPRLECCIPQLPLFSYDVPIEFGERKAGWTSTPELQPVRACLIR